MTCSVCGRDRVCTGDELGGQPGTYLIESSCHDGVWMDDDVHAEGWNEDEIYPPCPHNPRKCKTCGGSGNAPKEMAERLERDDCADCRGNGWQNGNNEYPVSDGELDDATLAANGVK